MVESFVGSFKTELIADRSWQSRTRLKLAVVDYLHLLSRLPVVGGFGIGEE